MKNIVKGLALALLVVFAFTSCAKQPTQLMDSAKAAVQGVIDAKGNIYAKDELGWTPLYWATYMGRTDVDK